MAAESGDMFKGFVFGSLIGLAVGVLFAPKSGRDMREDLMGDSDDLLGKAKDELDKIKAELGDLKDKITETLDRSKMVFDEAVSAEERAFEAEIAGDDAEPIETDEPKDAPKKRTRRKKTAAKSDQA
jgi:gas vesicle protein